MERYSTVEVRRLKTWDPPARSLEVAVMQMNPSDIGASGSVTHQRSWSLRLIGLRHYALAVVSAGFALAVSLFLRHFHFRVPAALLLLFVVAVSSWYGGTGPAVLAAALSIISLYWYFVEPVRTIYIYRSEIPFFLVFAGFAVLLSWFGTIRRRIEADLRLSNRKLRAIRDCNHVLLRATDEQSLLEKVCQIVYEEAGYCMALVAYAEHGEAKSIRPVAWRGTEKEYFASFGVTWAEAEGGQGPTGTAIRSGKTCCIQDFTTDPRLAPWRDTILEGGFRSGIALPLKDEHGNAFGSLSIYSAQPNAFTADEIRLLEELAGNLAFGVVTLRSQAARKRAEEEVSLFSFAVNNIRDAAFLSDEKARFHYVNEEACRVLGYTRAKLLGMTVPNVDLEIPVERWPERWLELETKRTVSFESWHRTRDGRIFPVEISGNYFEHGGRGYCLAFVKDITERKKAEEALRRSNAYNRSLIEASIDPLVTIGPDGKITDVNAATESATGLSRGELIGTDFCDYFTEPANARVGYQRAFQAGIVRDYPLELRHRDGRVMSVLYNASVYRDESGQAIGIFAAAPDITERKRGEEGLRRSEAYLAEAQRLTHAGSWALDAATREITYWSEEMFRIYGVHPQHGIPPMEAMGRRIHPEDRSRVHGTFEKSLREKVDTSEEYRLVLPSGTVKHVHVIRHPVLNTAGDIVELVGTFVDITERKLAEEERERLRQLESDLANINRISMMGELAAAIVHEVNQPLSGIVSNASASLGFLSGDAPDLEEAREAVRDIVRDGKRAGEIIARIRALTKGTAATREKLDLNKAIQDVLALVDDEARRSSASIRTQFAAGLSPVAGDRVQLQQVVLNLVMNAIESMKGVSERPRELVITTRNIDPDQVQVTVEDSGLGIAPDTVDRIFNPFYSTKPGGMGMGLYISRSILAAHGGRLWTEGKDGPGTIFYFTVPRYHEERVHTGAMRT